MIPFKLILLCSYSIAIAAVFGLIRFRHIHRTYQPFIFITLAALTNEIVSTLLIMSDRSNAISTNILNLTECALWLLQIKKWGGFRHRKWEFPVLFSILATIWIAENIIMGKIIIFSSVFAIVSAFILVFLVINQVNRLIVEERTNLLRNSKFLICVGAILFYTYRIMVESFYVLKLDQSDNFLLNIFGILVFVNLFVNLLFALAILWIPTRQRFSLPS